MSGAIRIILFCFVLAILLIFSAWAKEDRQILTPPIVIELKKDTSSQEFLLKKEDQKEIKKYCKENKINFVTKEEAFNQYNRKNSEIMAPLFQTPPDQLEEKKKKIKNEIMLIPEIARWITIKFYSSDTKYVDSTVLVVNSFPFSEQNNKKFKTSIVFFNKILFLDCIKASIDSCKIKNFLN